MAELGILREYKTGTCAPLRTLLSECVGSWDLGPFCFDSIGIPPWSTTWSNTKKTAMPCLDFFFVGGVIQCALPGEVFVGWRKWRSSKFVFCAGLCVGVRQRKNNNSKAFFVWNGNHNVCNVNIYPDMAFSLAQKCFVCFSTLWLHVRIAALLQQSAQRPCN